MSSKHIGSTYNYLTILEEAGKIKHKDNTYSKLVLCKCSCGKEKVFYLGAVVSGKTKSCGCYRSKTIIANMKTPYRRLHKTWEERLLSTHKRTCVDRDNLVTELTIEEFKDLINKKCFYCDATPENVYKYEVKSKVFEFHKYQGIDRVNNTKGYIKDNCVPCCKFCNTVKSSKSQQEFYEHVKLLYKNLIKKELIK